MLKVVTLNVMAPKQASVLFTAIIYWHGHIFVGKIGAYPNLFSVG